MARLGCFSRLAALLAALTLPAGPAAALSLNKQATAGREGAGGLPVSGAFTGGPEQRPRDANAHRVELDNVGSAAATEQTFWDKGLFAASHAAVDVELAAAEGEPIKAEQ